MREHLYQLQDGIEKIAGLKTAHDSREPVIIREKGKTIRTDDGSHMPRAQESVYGEIIRLDERTDGRFGPF